MTNKTDPPMSGEARFKARRTRFWSVFAIGMAASMAAGFATGYGSKLYENGTIPAWGIIAIWIATLAGLSWFTLGYFRQIDELDLLDNLWAGMIAFYFYIVAWPSWYLFHDLGMLAEPNQVVIYIATMGVMFVAYGLRKLGLR